MIWEMYPTTPLERITPRIKEMVESASYPEKNLSVDEYVKRGKDSFFNFKFPWYSEDDIGLDDFETAFLHRYYMYSIGQETEGLFKLNLQSRLMLDMPMYKQLFDSSKIEYDALINRDLVKGETIDATKDSDYSDSLTKDVNNTVKNVETGETGDVKKDVASGNSKDETQTQSIGSDNPQVTIATVDYASNMNRGQTQIDSSGSSTLDSTTNGTSSTTVDVTGENKEVGSSTRTNKDVEKRIGDFTEKGFIGESKSKAIMQLRETFLNINKEIIDSMYSLFLQVMD